MDRDKFRGTGSIFGGTQFRRLGSDIMGRQVMKKRNQKRQPNNWQTEKIRNYQRFTKITNADF